MKSTILDKTKLVNSVFSKVYKKYDLMNDIMSLGVHRIWKSKLIDWMNPQLNDSLIDVASGTGDIAKLFSKRCRNMSEITCVEPNEKMFREGKNNLKKFTNIKWIKSKAESLPVQDDLYDFLANNFNNVYIWDPREFMISDNNKFTFKSKDGLIMMQDQHHITIEFSSYLGKFFKDYLKNNLLY